MAQWRLKPLIAVMAVTLAGQAVAAAPSWIGAAMRVVAPSDRRDASFGTGVDAFYGFQFGPGNGIEIHGGGNYLRRSSDDKYDQFYHLGADVRLGLSGPRFSPFVLAGVGGAYEDQANDADTRFFLDLGAGFTYPLPWEQIHLRTEARWHSVVGSRSQASASDARYLGDAIVQVGLQLPLQSRGPLPLVADSDGDGVVDGRDQCPNTAIGAFIDGRGCTMVEPDQDADGIIDSRDQCPETAPASAVDLNGCVPAYATTVTSPSLAPAAIAASAAAPQAIALSPSIEPPLLADSKAPAFPVQPTMTAATTPEVAPAAAEPALVPAVTPAEPSATAPEAPVTHAVASSAAPEASAPMVADAAAPTAPTATPEAPAAVPTEPTPSAHATPASVAADTPTVVTEAPIIAPAAAAVTADPPSAPPAVAATLPEAPPPAPLPVQAAAPVAPDMDGDGVSNALDRCADSPSGLKVDAEGCLAAQAAVTIPVRFEGGTAGVKLSGDSKAWLDGLAKAMQTQSNVRIEVAGHTDALGPQANNLHVSEKRAEAVTGYLQAQGIAAARMSAEGYGEFVPVADNATESGRSQNRRIELTVILPPK